LNWDSAPMLAIGLVAMPKVFNTAGARQIRLRRDRQRIGCPQVTAQLGRSSSFFITG